MNIAVCFLLCQTEPQKNFFINIALFVDIYLFIDSVLFIDSFILPIY